MNCEVRIEQVESRPLAVVRRRASPRELARVVPAACGLVWGVVRAHEIAGAGRHVALYWDGEMNLEVGVELTSAFVGNGEVIASATPGGAVATAVHFGPYDQLGQVHGDIRHWCVEHGHELAGPNWEIYGHWQDEWNRDPGKIRTDVFYLLKTNADRTLAVAGNSNSVRCAPSPVLVEKQRVQTMSYWGKSCSCGNRLQLRLGWQAENGFQIGIRIHGKPPVCLRFGNDTAVMFENHGGGISHFISNCRRIFLQRQAMRPEGMPQPIPLPIQIGILGEFA